MQFDEEEKWRKKIAFEQVLSLLKRSSFVFASPEHLGRGFDVTPMTPIEELLANEFKQIRGVRYIPQYRISNKILDFLVEYNGMKVAVECDGRGFHQKELDDERDERIRELGYETLRFTGSEIFRDPKGCASKVKEFLEYKSKKSRRYRLDAKLDDSQLEAVKTSKGAARVLAPAGSGKTKTLVNRIIFLINQGVAPESILAMAFNKKAAEQMEERLYAEGIINVEVRTFHSFGNQIIKDIRPTWSLQDSDTPWRKLLSNVLGEQGVQIKPKRHIDPLDRYFKAIRHAKADLIPQLTIDIDGEEIDFQPTFYKFLDKQIKANIYSFDDQIYAAVRLLIFDENLRREIQQRYEYVLIDEFQDLTNAQIMLAYLTALPECNLFVVGDDDQMIYGWRGAQVEHILKFPQEYPTSDTIALSTNYRCTKKIVRHSNRLIKYNEARVDKDIRPVPSAEEGEFDIFVCQELYEQAEKVAQKIKELKENLKCKWSNIAVLYRYKALQISLIPSLDKYGIPHPPLMGVNIFNRTEALVTCDYLRVIKDPENAKGSWFKNVVNVPSRYLKNEFAEDLSTKKKPWRFLKEFVGEKGTDYRAKNIMDLLNLVEILNERYHNDPLDTSQLISELYLEGGIRDYYIELETEKKRDVDQASAEQTLDILLAISREFPKLEDFLEFADGQKEKSIEDFETVDVKKDRIQMYTIHASKGNEFGHVILYNLEEKDIKTISDNDEEERRIAYVGMTRAKKSLFVTTNKGTMSHFIKEMVFHPKYIKNSLEEIKNLLIRAEKTEEDHQEEVESIEKEIIEREIRLDEIKSKQEIRRLESDIHELELRKSEARSQLKRQVMVGYEKEIESIENRIIELEKRYGEVESKKEIRTLEKEIQELELKRSEAKSQLKKWECYIVPEAEGFIKSAYYKIFGNEEQKRKNKEVAHWQNKVNEYIHRIEPKSKKIGLLNKEREKTLAKIKNEIQGLKDRNKLFEGKIKELKNDIAEYSIDVKSDEITSWQNTLNDYESQIESKTRKAKTMLKEMPNILDGIEEDIRSFAQQKERFKSKINDLQNDIDELSIEMNWRKKLSKI